MGFFSVDMLSDVSFPSYRSPTSYTCFFVQAAEVGLMLVSGFFSGTRHVDMDLNGFWVGSNLLPDDGLCDPAVLLDRGLAVSGHGRLVPSIPKSASLFH